MKNYIDRQFEQNRNLNLFYDHLEEAVKVDSGFVKTILLAKRHNYNIEELLSYTVDQMVSNLYRINQYSNLSRSDLSTLRGIYKNTYETITKENSTQTIKEHHRDLSKWISKFYPDTFKTALKDNSVIGQVVNEEYSPQLQMDIYNLSIKSLMEPVLDIGCGPKAQLVKHLNTFGVYAVGIDRIQEEAPPFYLKKDWFNFSFEKETWGTIIANMSFTNHLIYTFNNDKEMLYSFLIKYKEILESLKKGGCFAYAPSVPMIEERLDPSRYEIDSIEISNGVFRTLIKSI